MSFLFCFFIKRFRFSFVYRSSFSTIFTWQKNMPCQSAASWMQTSWRPFLVAPSVKARTQSGFVRVYHTHGKVSLTTNIRGRNNARLGERVSLHHCGNPRPRKSTEKRHVSGTGNCFEVMLQADTCSSGRHTLLPEQLIPNWQEPNSSGIDFGASLIRTVCFCCQTVVVTG